MSGTTVFWTVLGALAFTEIVEAFRRRNWRQLQREMASILRDQADSIPTLTWLIEDLIRIEPEREEALSITRLDMIARQAAARKLADELEKRTAKRWWR